MYVKSKMVVIVW